MQDVPIKDHALIGDTRTAALTSSRGSIDWMCVPNFDGEPIFGRLLDHEHGGSFTVDVEAASSVKREYRPHSAVLDHHFAGPGGRGTLSDGLVVDLSKRLLPQLLLVRRVFCAEGGLRVRIRFEPRLGLPGRPPEATRSWNGLVCEWGRLAIGLHAHPDVPLRPDRETFVDLREGDALTLALTLADRAPLIFVPPLEAFDLLQETDRWWRDWSTQTTYQGPYRDEVERSIITLRLLTFSPSGAPVAAPTTSLPEDPGGTRNWDYRFSWIRDASIGTASLLALGKNDMAGHYLNWLMHATRLTRPRLEVMYTLYGTPARDEQEVEDISGYAQSRPVRMGNGASDQHQLDVYGWLLHAAWSLAKNGHELGREAWRALAGFADHTARVWRRPDAGIWERRDRPAHNVHSKLMAWVALGCAQELSTMYRTRKRRVRKWQEEHAAIESELKEKGFDPELGHYVQHYGTKELDAALLLLPIYGFDEGDRLRATVAAVRRALETEGGLYRYRLGSDALEGGEGVFLPCSFWLVEALVRLGDRDEAKRLFERALAVGNDVGLFSEEADATGTALLGNFPLAFTHATLVQAAIRLEQAEAP